MARPKEITLDRTKGELRITWQDEAECVYPLSQLREACPCVECRGGHQYMGMEYAPRNLLELKPARSYALTELIPVGNYAVMPVWDDGHNTGIYSWDYLFYLCPES